MFKGETILISASKCSYFPLISTDVIKNFLINSTEILGMTPVHDTLTIRTFPTLDGRGDFGISGFLILTESHISVHTWPQEKFIRVEYSSCKPREKSVDLLVECVKVTFNPGEIQKELVPW